MSAMYESMVTRMQHGFASRNGLTAAALAASGYVGIKRVFERPYGGWLAPNFIAHPAGSLSHARVNHDAPVPLVTPEGSRTIIS
jgi:hypothetical protein